MESNSSLGEADTKGGRGARHSVPAISFKYDAAKLSGGERHDWKKKNRQEVAHLHVKRDVYSRIAGE